MNPITGEQFDALSALYQRDPYLFGEEQASQMEEYAQALGREFRRDQGESEFNLMRTISQLGSGFVSGFTTLNVGDDPENVYEGIARSVGSVMGFVGYVPGAGMLGKLGAMAMVRGMAGTGTALKGASNMARSVRGRSVPLYVAERAVGRLEAIDTVHKFLSGSRLGNVARAGLELGVASSVSSWQEGIDEMVKGFGYGAVEGLGFRALTNYFDAAKLMELDEASAKGLNAFVRGTASSLYSGLPSTLRGEPLPHQVYEYLLGAYFGAMEPAYQVDEAARFIRREVINPSTKASTEEGRIEGMRDKIFNYQDLPGYKAYPEEVQQEIGTQIREIYGRQATNRSIQALAVKEGIEEATRRVQEGELALEDFSEQGFVRSYFDALEQGLSDDEAWSLAAETYRSRRSAVKKSREKGSTALPGLQERFDAGELTLTALPQDMVRQQMQEVLYSKEDHDTPMSLSYPLENFTKLVSRERPHEEGRQVARTVLSSFQRAWQEQGFTEAGWQQALSSLQHAYRPVALSEISRETKLDITPEQREKITSIFEEAGLEGIPDRETWKGLPKEVRQKALAVINEGFEGKATSKALGNPLEIDPKSREYRELRQAWKRMGGTYREPQVAIFRDEESGKFGVHGRGQYDNQGNKVEAYRHPSHLDRVMQRLGMEAATLSDIETVTKGGKRLTVKLYDQEEGFASVLLNSEASGYPYAFSVKDKGKGKHTKGYVFERGGVALRDREGNYSQVRVGKEQAREAAAVKRRLLQEVIDEHNATAKEKLQSADGVRGHLLKPFMDEISKYGVTPGDAADMYDRHWLNEIALLEQLNAREREDGTVDVIPFEEMVRAKLKGEGDFLLKAPDVTKRAQVIDDTSIPVSREYLERIPSVKEAGGLRMVIVNAKNSSGKGENAEGLPPVLMEYWDKDAGEVRKKLADHHLDGVTLLHKDVYDAIAEDMGLDPDAGTSKGVIMYANEAGRSGKPLGMMIGKLAFYRADDAASAAMDKSGLHTIVYDTAAKQTGFRKKYDMRLTREGDLHFYRPGHDNPQPFSRDAKQSGLEVYTIPFEGVKINIGTSEDAHHALDDINMLKQFGANFTDKAAIDHFVKTYVEPSIMGRPEAAEKVRQYFRVRDDKLVDDIDVEDIGVQDIISILTDPSQLGEGIPTTLTQNALYEKVWRHILRKVEQDPDLGSPEAYDAIDAIEEAFSRREASGAASRILEVAKSLSPATMTSEIVGPYAESVLRSYVVTRALKPRVPYSGQAILQPHDPFFRRGIDAGARQGRFTPGSVKDGMVQPGYFMLQDAWKSKQIRWIGGTKKRLGEAFEEYLDLKKRVKGQDAPEVLREMEDLLSFAVIRVPADSRSGTRMLKLAGFSGRKGAGITVHNEEMVYLGGADLDIDKVFFMQDPDQAQGPGLDNRPMRRHIEEHRYEWNDRRFLKKGADPSRRESWKHHVIVDSKANEDIFAHKLSEDEGHPFATGDPRLLYKTGKGARTGNKLLGTWANAGRRGDTAATLLNLPEQQRRRFHELKREGMNWSADAGGTAGLKFDAKGASQMLGQALFGKPMSLGKHPLIRSLSSVDEAANGFTYDKDGQKQRMDLWDSFDRIRRFSEQSQDSPLPNTWYRGLQTLGQNLNGRNMGKKGATREEMGPWVGKQWEERHVREFNQIQRQARKGYAPARLALGLLARKAVYLPERGSPGKRPYEHPYELHNDLTDVASVKVVYDAGKAAYQQGLGLSDLEGVAGRVSELKAAHRRAIGYGKDEDKAQRKKSVEEVRAEAAEYRESLPGPLQHYFDMYFLSSLHPQEMEERQYMKLAEAKHKKEQRARALEEGKSEQEAEAIASSEWEKAKQKERDFWWRTNQEKVGFELDGIIPDEAVRHFLEVRDELAQATFKKNLTPEERKRVSVLSQVDYAPEIAAITGNPRNGEVRSYELRDFGENFMEHVFKVKGDFDDVFSGLPQKEKDRARELYEGTKEVLKRHPQILDYYASVFERVTSEASERAGGPGLGVTPEMATARDIMDFMETLSGGERGLLLDYIYRRAKTEEGGLRFSRWMHMLFPDTIGKLTLSQDLHIGREVVRPVMTLEGIKDKLVVDVFSHLGEQHKLFSALQAQRTKTIEHLAHRREKAYGPLRTATGGDWDDLHRVAVALREYKEGDKVRDAYEGSRNPFYSALEAVKETRDRLRDKVYTVKHPGGRTERVTGQDLMGSLEKPGLINQVNTKLLSEDYKLIRNHEAEKRYLVSGRTKGDYDPADTDDYVDPARSLARLLRAHNETGKWPEIGMEGLHKISHEIWLRRKVRTSVMDIQDTIEGHIKAGRLTPGTPLYHAKMDDLRSRFSIRRGKDEITGQIDASSYWPHNGHDKKALGEYFEMLATAYEKAGADMDQKSAILRRLKWAAAHGVSDDAGAKDFIQDAIYGSPVEAKEKLSFTPPSMQSRGPVAIQGWDKTSKAVETYENQLANAYYNTLISLVGDGLMQNMRRKAPMGNKTEAWARMGDLYTMTVVGPPTVWPRAWVDKDHPDYDKDFAFERSPTHWVSDQQVEQAMRKADQRFFGGRFFRTEEAGGVDSVQMQRRLAHWTQLEGKWELMSLLASTKGMTNNYVGGSMQTIVSSGFRHWRRGGSLAHLQKINPDWDSWDKVDQFVIEKIGAIESYIVKEAHIPDAFRDGPARKAFDEVMAKLQKEPGTEDAQVKEILRKHGVFNLWVDGAAWFMRSVERRLRRRAAMAHYLKAREALEASGAVMKHDDAWLLEMARKGTEATQFLYDNANRPAFARTNLGRVLTRFQLWSMNSIRFRRDIYQEARRHGFQPGTEPFERFQRMAVMDLFMFGLAAIFPASLFDNILPAPWNYLEEFSDLFFGDEEERDRAFFGTLPYPISPLQIAMPPVSRIPITTFGALLSGDWDRFTAYHAWSFFPFGLMARNTYKTVDNPAMAIENMTGFPLHRVHREINQARDQESLQANF